MNTAVKPVPAEKFSFASSVKEDVWHEKLCAEAFEWWYFDALSDDGRDGVVVIFLDNFIFSRATMNIIASRTVFSSV